MTNNCALILRCREVFIFCYLGFFVVLVENSSGAQTAIGNLECMVQCLGDDAYDT